MYKQQRIKTTCTLADNTKITLSQQISANKMVYASIARGYKAGGYNVTSTTQKLPAYDPEYNWNYELGAKLAFLNGTLQTGMSLFYIDWKHQQVTTTVPGVGNIINNAGHSNSKGFELSATLSSYHKLRIASKLWLYLCAIPIL